MREKLNYLGIYLIKSFIYKTLNLLFIFELLLLELLSLYINSNISDLFLMFYKNYFSKIWPRPLRYC